MTLTDAPIRLRAEHLDQAFGIGERRPRLSWLLPSGSAVQVAYRLAADSGDTGWVSSSDSVLVPWPFPPLGSAERVTVRVAVRTDLGESPWSEALQVETGLLDAADWDGVASWVAPDEDEVVSQAGQRPAYELRGFVTVDRPMARARLYATAHGLYEVFLGGVRAGDLELTPGFTQYDQRLQVQAYDVTGLLSSGMTSITVLLSDGWWRGQVGALRSFDQWGSRTAFLGQLRIVFRDGTTAVTGTGPSWQSRPSHVLSADLIEGQRTDLRRAGGGDWRPVQPGPAGHGFDRLVWSPAPPVRRVEELRPVSVTRVSADRQVVDLGQNINGWVRLSGLGLGPAGTEVTLTHGEWLDENGDVTVEHLRPALPFLPHPLTAGQVNTVIADGLTGGFEPRHTTHGFQYVRVDDHPADLSPDAVTGVVVHTDMRRAGWFACSDDRVNRFHAAAVWSFRGNACDIPTDCPPGSEPAGPPTGSCSSLPPRSSTTWPVSRPSGCVTWSPVNGTTAWCPTCRRCRDPRAGTARWAAGTAPPAGEMPPSSCRGSCTARMGTPGSLTSTGLPCPLGSATWNGQPLTGGIPTGPPGQRHHRRMSGTCGTPGSSSANGRSPARRSPI